MTDVGSVSVAPPACLQSAPDNSTFYVCGALKAGENLTRCISAPVYQDASASTPFVTVTNPYNPAEVQVKINNLFKGGLAGLQGLSPLSTQSSEKLVCLHTLNGLLKAYTADLGVCADRLGRGICPSIVEALRHPQLL